MLVVSVVNSLGRKMAYGYQWHNLQQNGYPGEHVPLASSYNLSVIHKANTLYVKLARILTSKKISVVVIGERTTVCIIGPTV